MKVSFRNKTKTPKSSNTILYTVNFSIKVFSIAEVNFLDTIISIFWRAKVLFFSFIVCILGEHKRKGKSKKWKDMLRFAPLSQCEQTASEIGNLLKIR